MIEMSSASRGRGTTYGERLLESIFLLHRRSYKPITATDPVLSDEQLGKPGECRWTGGNVDDDYS
jgi:hypothetical protein